MTNSTAAAPDAWAMLESYASLFYLVNPATTGFTDLSQVPNYIVRAYPWFIMHLVLEALYLYLRSNKPTSATIGRPLPTVRLNDAITSISAGMFQQSVNAFSKTWTLAIYVFVWNNFRIVAMDPAALTTWVVAMLGVDFGYYWFHRLAHEVNIFWAAHVVHHSSEAYNQTTALRQSIVQSYFSWIFTIPMALCVPPPVYVTHGAFNTLFQFWIHTETVGRLGLLEYIINTPSSHRVHHGRNPYCIDKNYAGTLIIWDILFGTYQPELDTEPVLFGLTHGINTFDTFWVQFHHFNHIAKALWAAKGINHKLAVIFYGPGWTAEKPLLRTGDLNDIPRVPNIMQDPNADIGLFNPDIAMAPKGSPLLPIVSAYILAHFGSMIACQFHLQAVYSKSSPQQNLLYSIGIIYTLWVLSLFLNGRKMMAITFEAIRLIVVLPMLSAYLDIMPHVVPWVSVCSGAVLTGVVIADVFLNQTASAPKKKTE